MNDHNRDTPPQDFPSVSDATTAALHMILSEVRSLTKKVENVGHTIASHVTELAVIKVRAEVADQRAQDLAERVETLENERKEVAKAILAKCATLALFLAAAVAGVIAYFTR
jgi:chromosome segregation ATPase